MLESNSLTNHSSGHQMTDSQGGNLKHAESLWKKGDTLEAGRIIFENLPVQKRVAWAAKVLDTVIEHTGIQCRPIETLREIANDRHRWADGHLVFDNIRTLTLQVERLDSRTAEQDLFLVQLLLAEIVAKVVYNATNPDGPFDEDSGWWIAHCVKSCLDRINDAEFAKLAWRVLSEIPD